MDMLYWSSNDRLNLETDWASSDVVEATGGLRFSKERVRGSVKALGVLHCLRGRTEEKVIHRYQGRIVTKLGREPRNCSGIKVKYEDSLKTVV